MPALRSILVSTLLAAVAFSSSLAGAAELQPLLAKLHAVGPGGKGNRAAAAAWSELVKADAAALPALLTSLNDAGPLAANWIRGAVDTIAERELKSGGKLPAAELEKFVRQTDHAPRARRLAFEWLARVDKSAPDRIIPDMLNDPSVELRRDAVARLIEQAQSARDRDVAVTLFHNAFNAAVDDDQVRLLVESLKRLDVAVDLPRHYGFIMGWKLVGPFDNKDEKGYHVAYPPEKKLDLTASYKSKLTDKPVTWQEYVTTEEYGKVNLHEVFGKRNGALIYAVSHFQSGRERQVQFRLSSKNATKLWLNGKLIDRHEVYHAGGTIDQYISTGTLRKGRNVLLLKVCQNEQTQSWAQDWDFQFRVCDAAGSAIHSTNRAAGKAAE